MKKLLLSMMILSILWSCTGIKNNNIKLIEAGKSEFVITIPDSATAEELRAASFLQSHLFKISGFQLPVVSENQNTNNSFISISNRWNFEGYDGFSIDAQSQQIRIIGEEPRGCIYGVSALLERLGVRYYSPQFVIIPETKNLSLTPFSIQESSVNSYRNAHGSFTDNIDFKDFNRINTIEDMFADGYYVHTFNKLIPWQDYFTTHPEYFAYQNEKHIIDQLCLSQPDVLRLVKEKLRAEMALQPDKQVWSVSQGDNFSYCQCEKCSRIIEDEQSAAGPIIRFVNDIAREFPNKTISTLAYQYSRKAPALTKPLDNVQIMLCTIELNRSKPIAQDSTSVSFLRDLEDWGKITNHIYLWDYTVDFAHSISPFPNLHTLQPNIQLFVKNHVHEHFQQSNIGVGHEFSELKSFLISKLLWNPNVNTDSLITQFTNEFYGPAAPQIRKYIFRLQDEIVKSGEWLDIYGPPTLHQNTFLSAENIKAYNQYFDEAEKLVSSEPEFLLHVRTARMPLQYAMMEIGKNDMFGPRGWYVEANGDFIARKEMTQTLENFYRTSIACQSTPVNESGLSPKEYYESTLRFIDVQVKGNLAFRKKMTALPEPSEQYSQGNLDYLTNGVRGANDYKVHWLGWHATNFSLTLDLEQVSTVNTIEMSTLYDPKSWILHPLSVGCSVSENGLDYQFIGKKTVDDDQRKEPVNRLFTFETAGKSFRYIKFDVEGTLHLFPWHPSAGGESWVFVDEIVVR